MKLYMLTNLTFSPDTASAIEGDLRACGFRNITVEAGLRGRAKVSAIHHDSSVIEGRVNTYQPETWSVE